MKFIRSAALAISATILAFSPANATEGLAPAGPIGGTDLNQALLPPPGFYFGMVGGNIKLSRYRLKDSNSLSGRGDVNFGAIGGLYVYDTQLWGGQIASSIGIGTQKVCYGINPFPKNCSQGAMDIYTDLFMWSKFNPSETFLAQPKDGKMIPYGTAYMGALGVTWPTGEYRSQDPVNVGSNFYTISPSVALTHTAPSILGAEAGRATQFSARLFYNHYTKNKDTNYKTGDTVSIDYSVAEVINQWTVGMAGSAWKQIKNDAVSGSSNHISAGAATLSPIVQYDFMLNDQPSFIKAKYTFMVSGKNVTQSQGLTVAFGTRF